MSDERTTAAWMRARVQGRTAAASFVLRQAVGGAGAGEVETFEGPWSKGETFEGVAKRVLDAADEDAAGVGPGVYQYVLCAVSEAGRSLGRRPFRVFADGGEGSAIAPAESATASGVTAQLMRHMEARERLQTAGELRVLDRYEKLLAKAEARIEFLEGREAETVRLFEELSSRKAERDVALLKATQDGNDRSALVEKLTALIPHAGAKAGLIPAQGDAEVAALVEVMIKREVPIEGLMGGLPPEAQILFASIVQRYLPAKSAPTKTSPKETANAP